MDIGEFTVAVRKHAEQSTDRLPLLRSEAQTKNTLIEPLLKIMDYDTTHPAEVIPEYIADVGIKKGEKVDYALLQDGNPVILIECKPYKRDKANLNRDQADQLERYFNMTPSARIGILTNGAAYKFFSDLQGPNTMDKLPFFEFNLLKFSGGEAKVLYAFTRSEFSTDKAVALARELRERAAVRDFLEQQLSNPSEEFIRFVVGRVYKGLGTQAVRERYGRYIQEEWQLHRQGDAPDSTEPPKGESDRPPPPPPPPPPPGSDWRSLDQVMLDHRLGGPRPSAVRLPDDSEVEISQWKGVLIETVAWLVRERMLTDRLPVSRGRKTYIVNSEPLHPSGAPFSQPHRVADSVVVETHLDAKACLRNAAFLLKHFGEARPLHLRLGG